MRRISCQYAPSYRRYQKNREAIRAYSSGKRTKATTGQTWKPAICAWSARRLARRPIIALSGACPPYGVFPNHRSPVMRPDPSSVARASASRASRQIARALTAFSGTFSNASTAAPQPFTAVMYSRSPITSRRSGNRQERLSSRTPSMGVPLAGPRPSTKGLARSIPRPLASRTIRNGGLRRRRVPRGSGRGAPGRSGPRPPRGPSGLPLERRRGRFRFARIVNRLPDRHEPRAGRDPKGGDILLRDLDDHPFHPQGREGGEPSVRELRSEAARAFRREDGQGMQPGHGPDDGRESEAGDRRAVHCDEA